MNAVFFAPTVVALLLTVICARVRWGSHAAIRALLSSILIIAFELFWWVYDFSTRRPGFGGGANIGLALSHLVLFPFLVVVFGLLAGGSSANSK